MKVFLVLFFLCTAVAYGRQSVSSDLPTPAPTYMPTPSPTVNDDPNVIIVDGRKCRKLLRKKKKQNAQMTELAGTDTISSEDEPTSNGANFAAVFAVMGAALTVLGVVYARRKRKPLDLSEPDVSNRAALIPESYGIYSNGATTTM